jgi:hypothetical protein
MHDQLVDEDLAAGARSKFHLKPACCLARVP